MMCLVCERVRISTMLVAATVTWSVCQRLYFGLSLVVARQVVEISRVKGIVPCVNAHAERLHAMSLHAPFFWSSRYNTSRAKVMKSWVAMAWLQAWPWKNTRSIAKTPVAPVKHEVITLRRATPPGSRTALEPSRCHASSSSSSTAQRS